MNEQAQAYQEHIRKVVNQVHDSYSTIISDLVKQLSESRLDTMALSSSNQALNEQVNALVEEINALRLEQNQEEESYKAEVSE